MNNYYLSLIPILPYSLGGIADAIMDTCSDHFSVSIFKNLNPNYWNKNISWTNKYIDNDVKKGLKKWWIFNKPVALTDAWHLFKSIKEILNTLAITSAILIPFTFEFWYIPLYFILVGLSRDLVFDIFYNYLLKSK